MFIVRRCLMINALIMIIVIRYYCYGVDFLFNAAPTIKITMMMMMMMAMAILFEIESNRLIN